MPKFNIFLTPSDPKLILTPQPFLSYLTLCQFEFDCDEAELDKKLSPIINKIQSVIRFAYKFELNIFNFLLKERNSGASIGHSIIKLGIQKTPILSSIYQDVIEAVKSFDFDLEKNVKLDKPYLICRLESKISMNVKFGSFPFKLMLGLANDDWQPMRVLHDFSMIDFTPNNILRTYFQYNDFQISKFLSIAEYTYELLDYDNNFFNNNFSNEEIEIILYVLIEMIEQQFAQALPTKNPKYIGPEGAMGTLKQMFLESKYVGTQPNTVNISFRTIASIVFNKDIQISDYKSSIKWRDAANFIKKFMLIKAITESLNITYTDKINAQTYHHLNISGYCIHVNLIFADYQSRSFALRHFAEKNGGPKSYHTQPTQGQAKSLFDKIANGFFDNVHILDVYMRADEYWLEDASNAMHFFKICRFGSVGVRKMKNDAVYEKCFEELKKQMHDEGCSAKVMADVLDLFTPALLSTLTVARPVTSLSRVDSNEDLPDLEAIKSYPASTPAPT